MYEPERALTIITDTNIRADERVGEKRCNLLPGEVRILSFISRATSKGAERLLLTVVPICDELFGVGYIGFEDSVMEWPALYGFNDGIN